MPSSILRTSSCSTLEHFDKTQQIRRSVSALSLSLIATVSVSRIEDRIVDPAVSASRIEAMIRAR